MNKKHWNTGSKHVYSNIISATWTGLSILLFKAVTAVSPSAWANWSHIQAAVIHCIQMHESMKIQRSGTKCTTANSCFGFVSAELTSNSSQPSWHSILKQLRCPKALVGFIKALKITATLNCIPLKNSHWGKKKWVSHTSSGKRNVHGLW